MSRRVAWCQLVALCNAPKSEGSISKDGSVLIQTIERILEVGEGRELMTWWRGVARAEGGLEVVEICNFSTHSPLASGSWRSSGVGEAWL